MAANIYEDRNTLIPEVSNTFTLEFWVTPGPYNHEIDGESTIGNAGMFNQKFAWYPARGGTSNAGIGVSVAPNGISVYEHGLTEYTNHFPPLLVWEGAVSGWTHIAVVFVNKQPRLYVNGVLVRTGITSLRNVHPSTFCPGGYYSNAVLTKLDEVRVWDVARTAAEIVPSMNTEVSAASEHLLAYWPLNEGSGNVLQDLTGHGYNVQLSNGSSPIAWWDSGPQNLAHVMFNSYHYGFNGKEKSSEIYGEGNAYDFGARIHDPRLGRWLSVDPLQMMYPSLAPYNYCANTPISAKDPDGRVIIFINGLWTPFTSIGKPLEPYWTVSDPNWIISAQDRMGDHATPVYYDGSMGGAAKLLYDIKDRNPMYVSSRIKAGQNAGYSDAATILGNLKEGETIKIVTNSMGAAFARGFTKGILKYQAEENESRLENNARIDRLLDPLYREKSSIDAFLKDVPTASMAAGAKERLATQLKGINSKIGSLESQKKELLNVQFESETDLSSHQIDYSNPDVKNNYYMTTNNFSSLEKTFVRQKAIKGASNLGSMSVHHSSGAEPSNLPTSASSDPNPTLKR